VHRTAILGIWQAVWRARTSLQRLSPCLTCEKQYDGAKQVDERRDRDPAALFSRQLGLSGIFDSTLQIVFTTVVEESSANDAGRFRRMAMLWPYRSDPAAHFTSPMSDPTFGILYRLHDCLSNFLSSWPCVGLFALRLNESERFYCGTNADCAVRLLNNSGNLSATANPDRSSREDTGKLKLAVYVFSNLPMAGHRQEQSIRADVVRLRIRR